MRSKDIFLGAEYSGHYYLKYNDNYFEAPYFVIFYILKEMQNTGKTLSELIKPFRVYFHSGEINFKAENKEEVMEKIKDKYKDGKLSYIDGLRVDFNDWWFSLRASNTEPVLRLVVEAKNEELMKEKVEEITALTL
jgi:phosphomannomutase